MSGLASRITPIISRYQPTEEEKEMYKNYKDDKTLLQQADKFLMKVGEGWDVGEFLLVWRLARLPVYSSYSTNPSLHGILYCPLPALRGYGAVLGSIYCLSNSTKFQDGISWSRNHHHETFSLQLLYFHFVALMLLQCIILDSSASSLLQTFEHGCISPLLWFGPHVLSQV